MSSQVIHGDALDTMRGMEPGTVDAVLTDPPYCSGGFTETQKRSAKSMGVDCKFGWFEGDQMTTTGLAHLVALCQRCHVRYGATMKPEKRKASRGPGWGQA